MLHMRLLLFVLEEPGATELPVLAAASVSFEKWSWRACWWGWPCQAGGVLELPKPELTEGALDRQLRCTCAVQLKGL